MHLEVTLPPRSEIAAVDLLKKKRAWIERALQRIRKQKRVFVRRQLLLGGIPHRVRTIKVKRNCVKVRGRTVHVSLNDDVSLRPRDLADYVVLHEVSHLREFNHTGGFRALLFSLCPDFIEREQALRNTIPWTAGT